MKQFGIDRFGKWIHNKRWDEVLQVKTVREYPKNRKSLRWMELNKEYKRKVAQAKKKYYREVIKDIKTTNVIQWFSKLRSLCSYDRIKIEPVIFDSIKHLNNQKKAQAITDKFAKVSEEYKTLKNANLDIPDFDSDTIQVFKAFRES